MKKIYLFFKRNIAKRYKLSLFFATLSVISSGIASRYSQFTIVIVFWLSSSIFMFSKLIIFKTGKIPFFMYDSTWNKCKRKYGEDADEAYEEANLKHATIGFMVCIPSFLVWILCEIISALIQ